MATTDQLAFLEGNTGDMGALIRDFDWSKTSVGPVDNWSQSMRTLIRMMLTSRFPMLIFWGQDLVTFVSPPNNQRRVILESRPSSALTNIRWLTPLVQRRLHSKSRRQRWQAPLVTRPAR